MKYTRRQFFYSQLILFGVGFVYGFVTMSASEEVYYSGLPFWMFLALIYQAVVFIRRLRDMGQSPWWALTMIIPIVSIILWFVLIFTPTKQPELIHDT